MTKKLMYFICPLKSPRITYSSPEDFFFKKNYMLKNMAEMKLEHSE